MSIQPVNFYIPPEIQAGLVSGDLLRYGGVVRDQLGHIVVHLDELPGIEKAPEMLRKAVDAVKARPVIAAVTTLGGVVLVAGVAMSAAWKRKKTRARIESYNASLRAYLEAVRDANLDAEIVVRLLDALDAVQALTGPNGVSLDFSSKESGALVELVGEYTRELSQSNSVDGVSLPRRRLDSERAPIVDLRGHLEAQREIFAQSA